MNTTLPIKQALENKYALLLQAVQARQGEKRFAHTMAVAEETLFLSRQFSLSEDEQEALYVAALLHDITKKNTTEEQIALAQKYGIFLTEEDLASPPILHAITGSAVAANEFSAYTSEKICKAIRYHTTGDADMTLFDKLLFLADYIEKTRTHPVCIQTRTDFYQSLSENKEKEDTLDRFIVLISKNTKEFLEAEGRAVHSLTLKTIDSLSQKK